MLSSSPDKIQHLVTRDDIEASGAFDSSSAETVIEHAIPQYTAALDDQKTTPFVHEVTSESPSRFERVKGADLFDTVENPDLLIHSAEDLQHKIFDQTITDFGSSQEKAEEPLSLSGDNIAEQERVGDLGDNEEIGVPKEVIANIAEERRESEVGYFEPRVSGAGDLGNVSEKTQEEFLIAEEVFKDLQHTTDEEIVWTSETENLNTEGQVVINGDKAPVSKCDDISHTSDEAPVEADQLAHQIFDNFTDQGDDTGTTYQIVDNCDQDLLDENQFIETEAAQEDQVAYTFSEEIQTGFDNDPVQLVSTSDPQYSNLYQVVEPSGYLCLNGIPAIPIYPQAITVISTFNAPPVASPSCGVFVEQSVTSLEQNNIVMSAQGYNEFNQSGVVYCRECVTEGCHGYGGQSNPQCGSTMRQCNSDTALSVHNYSHSSAGGSSIGHSHAPQPLRFNYQSHEVDQNVVVQSPADYANPYHNRQTNQPQDMATYNGWMPPPGIEYKQPPASVYCGEQPTPAAYKTSNHKQPPQGMYYGGEAVPATHNPSSTKHPPSHEVYYNGHQHIPQAYQPVDSKHPPHGAYYHHEQVPTQDYKTSDLDCAPQTDYPPNSFVNTNEGCFSHSVYPPFSDGYPANNNSHCKSGYCDAPTNEHRHQRVDMNQTQQAPYQSSTKDYGGNPEYPRTKQTMKAFKNMSQGANVSSNMHSYQQNDRRSSNTGLSAYQPRDSYKGKYYMELSKSCFNNSNPDISPLTNAHLNGYQRNTTHSKYETPETHDSERKHSSTYIRRASSAHPISRANMTQQNDYRKPEGKGHGNRRDEKNTKSMINEWSEHTDRNVNPNTYLSEKPPTGKCNHLYHTNKPGRPEPSQKEAGVRRIMEDIEQTFRSRGYSLNPNTYDLEPVADPQPNARGRHGDYGGNKAYSSRNGNADYGAIHSARGRPEYGYGQAYADRNRSSDNGPSHQQGTSPDFPKYYNQARNNGESKKPTHTNRSNFVNPHAEPFVPRCYGYKDSTRGITVTSSSDGSVQGHTSDSSDGAPGVPVNYAYRKSGSNMGPRSNNNNKSPGWMHSYAKNFRYRY